MRGEQCIHCGSTNTKTYEFKPPPLKRSGFHRCDPTCTKPAILCLKCRMVREIHGEETQK
ncbi:hypothetical protein P1P75_01260 [Streptomyces sp. ID05-39B]|uniref:hypothetical protein n=1 Tax=Streptomyces sp. ID05-39B TaxID=3028664 RepID=UPI0029A4C04E|nr:hypothetical protein [Streptomyces sp. ID05-39B]MDX3525110.1 hypothetical protein [Streptomyces sp. ID05-39B]